MKNSDIGYMTLCAYCTNEFDERTCPLPHQMYRMDNITRQQYKNKVEYFKRHYLRPNQFGGSFFITYK